MLEGKSFEIWKSEAAERAPHQTDPAGADSVKYLGGACCPRTAWNLWHLKKKPLCICDHFQFGEIHFKIETSIMCTEAQAFLHCVMSGALLCSTNMCKKTTVHMCDNTKFKSDSDFPLIVAS